MANNNFTGVTTVADKPFTEYWWFNAAWFQLTWFCAVLGREPLLPVTAGMVALHLCLVAAPWRELRCLLVIALPGILVDAALRYAGVFVFDSDWPIPLWLCLLWLGFATTLNRSLDLLRQRAWLAFGAGALAPLNYLAGERLGAVTFGHSVPVTLALLVVVWILLLPLLCTLTTLCREQEEPR